MDDPSRSNSVSGPLIAVLTTGGKVLAKQGSLVAAWTTEYSGVSKIAVASDSTNGPLIAVRLGQAQGDPENAESFAELGITELVCDVRSEAQVHALVERAVADGGSLHIVVSNAGIDLEVQVPQVSEAQWDACLDTNLKGSFFVAKHSIPHLRAAGGGAVVFTSSNAGLLPRAHDPVYCVSKAALNALSNSLALCHAPDRIRFNTVCPGPVADTGLIETWLATAANRAAMRRY